MEGIVDVCLVIKGRLEELGLGQKDLAAAAEVTESYVSQLLARKKLPPAPERTDIYEKMAKFLKLPSDRLSKLAELQRVEELKRDLAGPPAPMFRETRELILRKCIHDKRDQVRAIFEKQPFGELERLVTQKLLDVIKKVAKEELNSETWLHLVARLAGRSYEQLRVTLLEFLDTDVFSLSPENCASFLDPLIESWDVDLTTFAMEIVLNRRIASGDPRRFAFVETGPDQPELEPGFQEFVKDHSLSGTATAEEIALLRKLRFNGKRPTALYYYRELQSLRDPLHFRPKTKLVDKKTQLQTKGSVVG
jgi:transcriptional regulator with XRE-family HTH domain